MNNLEVDATIDNWGKVYKFLNDCLVNIDVGKKITGQILIASEEIFVNISRYAYKLPSGGKVEINFRFEKPSSVVKIKFVDSGIFFDPTKFKPSLAKGSAGTRSIGGLGLFMVRNIMDKMIYEYKNNQNNLIIIKKIDWLLN